jgi:hypothetical protein
MRIALQIVSRFFYILILISLAACQILAPAATLVTGTLGATPSPPTQGGTPVSVTQGATPSPPTLGETAPPLDPTEGSVPTQAPTADLAFQVHWHPDGPLYVGDQLSLEVIPPPGSKLEGKSLQVQAETPQGAQNLGEARFEPFGLGERLQATLWWFWDTTALEPGEHTLTFSVLPNGPTWQETVILLPQAELPPAEAGAKWLMAESQCCQLHYIRGTAADRDIAKLLAMADQQAQDVSQKLGILADEKIPIVLIPRVLGHGGFTAQEIVVSYLDRNYAGNGASVVLHHEIVHWLDGKLGGDLRPSMLVEGLAVYLTGGHFKLEPVFARAAALLPPVAGCVPALPGVETGINPEQSDVDAPVCSLDRFIPLRELADHFYPSQHEIGYMEAGALVAYLVNTYGWQAFSDFYRDIHPVPQNTGGPQSSGVPTPTGQAAAIDISLKKHFQIGLDELEGSFRAALRQEPLTAAQVADVQVSINYFDTMRRYQKLLDPSAYFLTAWLADSVETRKRNIVADFLRHPLGPDNLVLENLFVDADAALRAGDTARSAQFLAAINAVLDRISTEDQNASSLSAWEIAPHWLFASMGRRTKN